MKAIILVCGTALLLAGCSKADNGADDPATTASGPMNVEEAAKKVDAIRLEPGEWQATQEIMDVKLSGTPQGMPADAMKQMIGKQTTVKHCVTPEQAAKPSADMLAAQKDANCTYSKMDMVGGKLSANVVCKAPPQAGAPGADGTMKMAMTGTYMPQRYDMVMEMETGGLPNGMAMTMKMKSSGKRIGACPPDKTAG